MLYDTQVYDGYPVLLTSNLMEGYKSKEDKIPDKVLWEDFKKGNEIAFVRIYKNYYGLLFDYGCRYAADKEMVRDCLQDFFLYLRKNCVGFSETTSIRPYLLKAFRRRIIEYLKKSNHHINLNFKDASEYLPLIVESSTESAYINEQVKEELLERLKNALNSLNRKEKKAIYYFYFKGFSYEQVAEMLHFTHVSSARRVMYKGLRNLRRFF